MALGVPFDQAATIREACAADRLHESAAPEAIRAAQRSDVAAAVPAVLDLWHAAGFEPTTGQLAECVGLALDLPTWSVECRLAELAGRPVPYRCLKSYRTTGDARNKAAYFGALAGPGKKQKTRGRPKKAKAAPRKARAA